MINNNRMLQITFGGVSSSELHERYSSEDDGGVSRSDALFYR